MTIRRVAVRLMVALVVIHVGVLPASAAEPGAPAAARRSAPSWGAIASQPLGYGYSFNQKSQAAAEQVAKAQCERPTEGKASISCEVRIVFDRTCAALSAGNFGEWGAASAGSKNSASKAAIAQCNGKLPTEPCKAVVSVCSVE